MNGLSARPKRSGYGDVLSVFVFILSVAIGLQIYSGINRYAELRSNGVTVEGYWAGRFTNPADGEPYGIYYFVTDGRTYNAQQVLDERVEYTSSGDPVLILYLPDNPTQSRIVGTEGYRFISVVQMLICLVAAVLSLQYFIAYYAGRKAWVSMLLTFVQRFTAGLAR